MDFAAFVPAFASSYASKVDCADLALDSLLTFARDRKLPVRLFDFDGPPGNRKRWLIYDPRRDDWNAKRAYLLQQLGAINVIENSDPIALSQARAGDLIMHENRFGGGYTGHTRLIISTAFSEVRQDYLVKRYEGNLPPVVPELKEGWFKDIPDVKGKAPRRWNFGQFGMR